MNKVMLITLERMLIYILEKKQIQKSEHKRYDFFIQQNG